ncbi:LarC family nickel insertion protein [uncultured Pseudodesulfovibrio sp.]|uniref:LarC family nickel insertion protein n=1 Tax=uncultured Pseudodesulfovibrio sp. TaxID=2035858 RepID=UPI0029C6B75F|nr:LarC family nickel insertion protein [uncultured Pseudodesulfovibrio sp.]
MNTVYLDCSTGVSGDMLLSALSHALEEWRGSGSGFGFLEKELSRLGLDGFGLKWSDKSISGIKTKHVDVLQTREQPLRHYTDLCRIIEESGLGGRAKERSIEALRLLGLAEAKVHGVDLEQVHFHEIGAVDTLADICGSMLLLDALEAEKVVCSPVDLGSGFVQCAHGKMPVPAPACAELAKGLTTFGSDCGMERATPTGLTILRTVVDSFGSLPMGTLLGVGYGSGGRSSDEQPTYVRAMLLENVAEG